MATSVTREVIAAISKGPCAAVLKPAGFRRAAPHFWRDVGGINHAVNFQASQWGSADSGKFTINLGVSIPAVYQRFFGQAFPTNRGTALWPLGVRLGVLVHGTDHWWTVKSPADAQFIGEEVAAALTAHALPFFAQATSTDDFVRWIRAPKPARLMIPPQAPLILAVMTAENGNRDEASSLLVEALAKHRGKLFEPTVRRIADRLGIRLDEEGR